jgi:hypothetical protein
MADYVVETNKGGRYITIDIGDLVDKSILLCLL